MRVFIPLLLTLAARPEALTLTTLSLDEHLLSLREESALTVRASAYGDGCSRCRCQGNVDVAVDPALRRLSVTMEGPDDPPTSSPCRALPITSGEVAVGPLAAGDWTLSHPGLSVSVSIPDKAPGR